jgi:hypothetical protein
MKKFLLFLSLVVAAGILLSSHLHADFKKEINGIELTVVDVGQNPDANVLYIGDKYYTTKDWIDKGLYPLRIMLRNHSDRPIVVGPESLVFPNKEFLNLMQTLQNKESFPLRFAYELGTMLKGSSWPICFGTAVVIDLMLNRNIIY